MSKISDKRIKEIMADYFREYGFAYHQISSFNTFILRTLPRLITDDPELVISVEGRVVTVSFSNVYVPMPTVIESDRKLKKIYPYESRTRDLTYDSPIYVDVKCVIEKQDTQPIIQEHRRIEIGRIPIMLRSAKCYLSTMTPRERMELAYECEYDQGGYFIINGKERVLVGQCRDTYNVVFVFPQNNKKWLHVAEIRSMSEETGHSVQVKAMIGKDERSLHFSLPYIKTTVPMGVVFKAYDFTEKDVINMIGISSQKGLKYLKLIIRDFYIAENSEEALKIIGRGSIHVIKESERASHAEKILSSELFPHLGVTSTAREKGYMLGHMVNRLISTHIGMRSQDDRDNYMNKRLESAGTLMADLFRQLFKKYTDSIVTQIQTKKQNPEILSLVSRSKIITNGFSKCFGTGDWGVQAGSYMKVGVSQILSRLSYGGTLSHLRRFSLTVGKEVKTSKVRQINPSSIMFVCPWETPEGEAVGVVLNLTLMTNVSERAPTTIVKNVVEICDGMTLLSDFKENSEETKVFVNGALIGFCINSTSVINELRRQREYGVLPLDVSISYNATDDEVHIWCDEGRLIRPVFEVKDSEITLNMEDGSNWNNLVASGKIKYIDNWETNNAIIAFDQSELKKYRNDYCEISPSMMMSIMAAIIPFPEHSPSPRICYIAAMGKQAMSMFSLAHAHRTDTMVNVLHYPQKPLVSTEQARIMGFNEMPTGINAIVAILCHGGKNQEDCILVKKEAIERGLFIADTYRTHVETEKKDDVYVSFKIGNPPVNKRMKDANYGLLGQDGVILSRHPITKQEVYVETGDVIIGKMVVITNKDGTEKIEDCSLVIKKGEEGYIDKVIKNKLPNGHLLVKVKIRTKKIPEIGDKFVSRAAQKGTLGDIVPSYDMPFTSDGIVPDIFLNPHAIPSRMTLNQLMETVMGKACAMSGQFGDATVFGEWSQNSAERICDMLGKYGFERTGTEQMFSGITGEPLDVRVFIGPTYYQRLKHLVSEKYHARARGPMNTMFRQPMSGRSKGGGHRIGEMEAHALAAHGTSWFLHERMCKYSDPFEISVCDKCHNFSVKDGFCKACEETLVSRVSTSYASKLLIQELNALCFKTELIAE